MQEYAKKVNNMHAHTVRRNDTAERIQMWIYLAVYTRAFIRSRGRMEWRGWWTMKKAEQETDTGVFDVEEIYEGCTVQVLRNTKTGEVSVGWWIGTADDEPSLCGYNGLPS